MSQTADDTKAAVDVLLGKEDLLLAAFTEARAELATLTGQVRDLQTQIANSPLSAADQAELTSTIASIQAGAAKIDAALTSVPPGPPSP